MKIYYDDNIKGIIIENDGAYPPGRLQISADGDKVIIHDILSSNKPILKALYNKIENEHGDVDTSAISAVNRINSNNKPVPFDTSLDFTQFPDGTELVIVNGNIRAKPKIILIESVGWTTTTRDIDNPISDDIQLNPNSNTRINEDVNIPETGRYKISISFLFAHDNTGNDFESKFLINGNEVALSQPSTKRILKLEHKDSSGENDDNPNADTSQLTAYQMTFCSQVLNAGPNNIKLLYGPDQNGTQSSIAELSIKIERIY